MTSCVLRVVETSLANIMNWGGTCEWGKGKGEVFYIWNRFQDQQKIAKVGLEMKLLTSEVDAEAEKWDEYAENDIVKRAKAMSSMAYNMYLFTRGDGPLKTTHDLFTQAEFFAEQANKMYKTVREFSYEVSLTCKLGLPESIQLK